MGRCKTIGPNHRKVCISDLNTFVTLACKQITSTPFNDNGYDHVYTDIVGMWVAIDTARGVSSGVEKFSGFNTEERISHSMFTRFELIDISVSSITLSGNIATVVTSLPHFLKTGVNVVISGANESEYNGQFPVSKEISATSFEYIISGSPSSPATGTIIASREIQTTDVIKLENQIYTIQRIDPVDERHEFLILYTTFKGPFN